MSDNKANDSGLVPYTPSNNQRMAKARFWQVMETNWRAPDSLSISDIAKITGVSSIGRWMQDPQFQTWFFNANAAQQIIQANKEIAAQALVNIIQQPIDPKEGVTAPSQVRAAELLMQYAGMEPPKKVEKKTTQGIVSDMEPEQLKVFLKTHMKKLLLSMSPEDRDDLLDVVAVKSLEENSDEK